MSCNCTCLVVWSALSVFAYTSFSPMVSFHHRNQFSAFCASVKTKSIDTYRPKSKDIYHKFFSHQFSTITFCHPPSFTLSFSTLTVFFHLLCHRHQFSQTILCPLVLSTCIFYLLIDFAHLQISPICRFYLLADFIYLHLSCWLMLLSILSFLGFEDAT